MRRFEAEPDTNPWILTLKRALTLEPKPGFLQKPLVKGVKFRLVVHSTARPVGSCCSTLPDHHCLIIQLDSVATPEDGLLRVSCGHYQLNALQKATGPMGEGGRRITEILTRSARMEQTAPGRLLQVHHRYISIKVWPLRPHYDPSAEIWLGADSLVWLSGLSLGLLIRVGSRMEWRKFSWLKSHLSSSRLRRFGVPETRISS